MADETALEFELEDTAAYVLKHGYTRLALQFPDELLKESPAIVSALRAACNCLEGLADEDNSGKRKFFVLADTTYGSCCVDEVAAAHVDAQCVLHYGHACLSSTSRLPARFIFGKAQLDVADCAAKLLDHARQQEKALLVLFGLEYAYKIQALYTSLEAGASIPPPVAFSLASVIGTEVTPAQSPLEQPQPTPTPTLCSCSGSHTGPLPAGSCYQSLPAGSCCQISPAGSHCQSLPAGSHCQSQPVTSDCPVSNHSQSLPDHCCQTDNRIQSSSEAESSGSERMGGLIFKAPQGYSLADCIVAWVGQEGAALTNVMMTYASTGCEFVRYNPEGKTLLADIGETSRALKRRYYLVEKAKNAHIVGIVVGTLSTAGYLGAIQKLRQLIKSAGKKSYTILVGKPNPAKLANFPECEVFVLVACPQTALLDSKEYLAPVISPFEAQLAWQQGRRWTGAFRVDFDMLLENQEGELEGASRVGNDEEPRFSLVSSRYERGASKPTEETSGTLDLAVRADRALQLKEEGLAMSGRLPSEVQAQTGAEYLVLKRSYQGLEVPPHLAQVADTADAAPLVYAVMGRSGRAAGYEGEQRSGHEGELG